MHPLPVPSLFCFLRYAVLHFSCFVLYFIIIIIIIDGGGAVGGGGCACGGCDGCG